MTDMLNSCNLESLEIRRRKQKLKTLFRIIQGILKIPKDEYIRLPGKRSARLNHDAPIKPFNARTDIFRWSFFPDAIEQWNCLPHHVVNSTDVQTFDREIDAYFGHG